MAARNFVAIADAEESQNVRSLFSKYQSISHPVISNFISSIPESFLDAVNRLSHTPLGYSSDDYVLQNRAKLQKFISKFHLEANTLSIGVRRSLALLTDPTTKIFISAHQPNLFAYGGVFKKIVLLQSLQNMVEKCENKSKAVNLFLIADHDLVDELWLHCAQLPSIRHSSGRLELRLPLNKSMRRQMVCNIPLPKRAILESWREQIDSWIRNYYSSSLSAPKGSSFASDDHNTASIDESGVRGNFEEFWQQVELSYSRAKSYSDFNSFFMSQLVNGIWGYDTLFVRLTDITSVFEGGFKYLISNSNTYSEALRQSENTFSRQGIDNPVSSGSHVYAPLWVHCNCGSKAPAMVREKRLHQQQYSVVLEGNCMACKNDCQINLGNKDKLELLEGEVIHDLSPRAIPLLLLLSRDLEAACYASGTAGIHYIIYGAIAFKELSIKMPLTLVWPSSDIYNGIAQSEALKLVLPRKQSNLAVFLELLKQKDAEYENRISAFIAERMQRINAGEPIQTLLSDLFDLKKEQRKIRRLIEVSDKVKNALDTKPCFVDYAVNLGMMNTEIQWRENLLNNNNLAEPIHMTTQRKTESSIL